MVDAMPEEQVKYMTGALCAVGERDVFRVGWGGGGVRGSDYSGPELVISAGESLPPRITTTPPPASYSLPRADKIPMKRCGLISEIASLAAFIASKECSFTTGFTFDATGGRAVY